MSYLPKDTQLGKLEYLEIYDQYDSRPCLFSCRNQNGQNHLAVWVKETDDGDKWLYAALSPIRLKWLREEVIDIRSVFTQAVSGSVYDIRTNKSGVSNVEILSCFALTDDLLPVAGEFLKYN